MRADDSAPIVLGMPVRKAFDRHVLEYYAQLVPQRCTYPEFPSLQDSFGERQYRAHIERSNASLIPRRLSIHVRVPTLPGGAAQFAEQVLREIELVAPLFDQDRDVIRLQWEGAADRLDPELSHRILDSIRRRFYLAGTAEFRCRIDLNATNIDSSRLSSRPIGETHLIDVQLTYGRSSQSMDDFAAAIDAVVAARPQSIDLVDGALTLQDTSPAPGLDAVTRLAMLELAVNRLTDAGYAHVYKGRFERAEAAGHTSGCDRVGLGPGAVSRLGDGVSESTSDISGWQAAIDARHLPVARGLSLTRAHRQRVHALRQLLHSGDPGGAARPAGELGQLESLGLVRSGNDRLFATSSGRYLWRILAQCFDSELQFPARAASRKERHAEERGRGETTQ